MYTHVPIICHLLIYYLQNWNYSKYTYSKYLVQFAAIIYLVFFKGVNALQNLPLKSFNGYDYYKESRVLFKLQIPHIHE